MGTKNFSAILKLTNVINFFSSAKWFKPFEKDWSFSAYNIIRIVKSNADCLTAETLNSLLCRKCVFHRIWLRSIYMDHGKAEETILVISKL